MKKNCLKYVSNSLKYYQVLKSPSKNNQKETKEKNS